MIIQGMCDSFRGELFQGIHNFNTDTIKVALYSNTTATLNSTTTVYTSVGEISGTGYTAGGEAMTGQSITTVVGASWINWANPSWPGASFSADGAMFYNASKGNRAIMVLNFGVTRFFNSVSNSLILPDPTASTALLRLA